MTSAFTVRCNTFLLLLILFFCAPSSVSGHVLDYGALDTQLKVQGSAVYLTLSVPLYKQYDFNREDAWIPAFQQLLQGDTRVTDGEGDRCEFTLTHINNRSRPGHTVFEGVYQCPHILSETKTFHFLDTLFLSEFRQLDNYVTVSFGYRSQSFIFNHDHTEATIQTSLLKTDAPWTNFFTLAWLFIKLGVDHILTGYDHMLFLLSLVLLIRSFRSILVLVTAFTTAHSITLILASFHIVTLSPRIVEPAIALTIAFMATRDFLLLRQGVQSEDVSKRTTWILVFAFGLIHGLGFATALGETDIPRGYLIPSLISFNVGIELGQLLVLAIVLPVLWGIDRLRSRVLVFQLLSATMVLLAVLWLITRVVFGEACSTYIPWSVLQFLCI